MTLILTVLTRKNIVQVSDRRVTTAFPGGRTEVDTDNENKTLYVVGKDCHFAAAYTGLARIAGEPTDRWLARHLGSATQDLASRETMISRLTGPALDQLKRLAPQPGNGRVDTTIVLAGFVKALNKRFRFIEIVSSGHTWHRNIIRRDNETIVAHGSVAAISDGVVRRIRELSDRRFFRAGEPEAVAEKLVSLVREVADDPMYGKYVGRDCMAVMVGRDPGLLSSRRFVADPGGPQYANPVTGSPIVVIGNASILWQTREPEFSLREVRFGDGPTPVPRPGEKSFRITDPLSLALPRPSP